MAKTFIDAYGKEYTVRPCTAIAECDDYQESERQEAVLVSNTADWGERFDYVVFGWTIDMLNSLEDFETMRGDASMWDSDWETLETVRSR